MRKKRNGVREYYYIHYYYVRAYFFPHQIIDILWQHSFSSPLYIYNKKIWFGYYDYCYANVSINYYCAVRPTKLYERFFILSHHPRKSIGTIPMKRALIKNLRNSRVMNECIFPGAGISKFIPRKRE